MLCTAASPTPFTRGESDALRKAMGKKLRDKLDHMKPKFVEGGRKNGHDPKVLEKIWADWEKFASYAFNKSHATCYSWVAYQILKRRRLQLTQVLLHTGRLKLESTDRSSVTVKFISSRILD